jgi:hypothetical protein
VLSKRLACIMADAEPIDCCATNLFVKKYIITNDKIIFFIGLKILLLFKITIYLANQCNRKVS